VRLEAPAWWYEAGPAPLALLLRPLAGCYGWLTERRFRTTQSYRSSIPVICAGNFTAGGTGKTPLALRLADELARLGERPAFLTRGYGGRTRGPHWVDSSRDTPGVVGDEALLLARRTATMVAADRAAGAQAIAASPEGYSAIVMDDGLQNPTLAKDLAIAVVDGVRGFGNGEVLPAGPLRAPLTFQLGIVDAIVVNGGRSPESEARAPIVLDLKQHFPGPVLETAAAPSGDVGWLAGARVVAYAGIGHPKRFFDLLSGLGAELCSALPFPDHHVFTEADARRLLGLANGYGAALVTTAKDVARLAHASGTLAELREASRELAIELAFEPREAARLTALLTTVLAARRQSAAPPS
jgi:tetraacyldisaccharide 4'-kinase